MSKPDRIDCPLKQECPLADQKLLALQERRVVGKGYGIYALAVTIPVVLLIGIAFSFQWDESCSRVEGQKGRTCTQNLTWKGWQGVPLQAIGSAVGTGFAVYSGRSRWMEALGKFVNGGGKHHE